jgi:hypothetical protein
VAADYSQSPVRDGSAILVETKGGHALLSTADGSSEPVGEDGRFLCREHAMFDYALEWYGSTRRRGGYLDYLCDPAGKPIDESRTLEAARLGGVPAGDLRLVATKNGLAVLRRHRLKGRNVAEVLRLATWRPSRRGTCATTPLPCYAG